MQESVMIIMFFTSGPVAQLGARFHGMEEVIGSNPIRSTKSFQTLSAPTPLSSPSTGVQLESPNTAVLRVARLPRQPREIDHALAEAMVWGRRSTLQSDVGIPIFGLLGPSQLFPNRRVPRGHPSPAASV